MRPLGRNPGARTDTLAEAALSLIRGMGAASEYAAALTLALYITGAEVSRLYRQPDYLFGSLPALCTGSAALCCSRAEAR